MVKKTYVPTRGDIVYLNFEPQSGKEITKRRPALVLTDERYNKLAGLIICCPITSKEKGYPFEVKLAEQSTVRGVILVDQIKSLDWKMREAEFVEKIPQTIFQEVLAKLFALLY